MYLEIQELLLEFKQLDFSSNAFFLVILKSYLFSITTNIKSLNISLLFDIIMLNRWGTFTFILRTLSAGHYTKHKKRNDHNV